MNITPDWPLPSNASSKVEGIVFHYNSDPPHGPDLRVLSIQGDAQPYDAGWIELRVPFWRRAWARLRGYPRTRLFYRLD